MRSLAVISASRACGADISLGLTSADGADSEAEFCWECTAVEIKHSCGEKMYCA